MNPTPLTILLGLILPPIMGLVTRFIPDSDGRFWASIGLCLVFGVGVNYIDMNGNYSGMLMKDAVYSMIGSGLDLIALSQVTYKGFWDNSAIGKLIPDKIVEGAKSPMKIMHLKPTT